MNFLDLAQADQGVALGPQPNEQPRLPATFGEAFRATWDEARLFSQSSARGAAQVRALSDMVDETRQRTGLDLTDAVSHITIANDFDAANRAVAKLNAENPDAHIDPFSPEEIDRRAVLLGRQARQTYGELAAREKGPGGGVGQFLGGLAGAASDPINLVTIPFGGGEAGVLATALKFGGLTAAAQVANEAVAAPYREQVQPGYAASGEPLANILEAGASGAVLGGATRALGNVWTRVKTGAWPTSVRDAGNLVESEANVQVTNPLPGTAGEVAHREALGGAVDAITKGEPVDVSGQIPPDLAPAPVAEEQPAQAARSGLAGALEGEPVTARGPEAAAEMLASPDHEAAIRADLDRARATADVKIPAGVDAEGEPVFRSLDSALDEVDAFKKAADEIQACAAPVQEAAE